MAAKRAGGRGAGPGAGLTTSSLSSPSPSPALSTTSATGRQPVAAAAAWSSPSATAAAMGVSTPRPSSTVANASPTGVGLTSAAQPNNRHDSSATKSSPERQRLVYLLLTLIGTKVVATTKEGKKYCGILAAASPESELSVALRQAQVVDKDGKESQNESTLKANLLIAARDLLELHAHDVTLETGDASGFGTNPVNREGFKTDMEVTGSGLERREKQLQAWTPALEEESSSGGFEGNLASMRLDDSGKGGWDQFATNERLYGTRTDYHEELYTTKLDRTSADYRQREQRAARLEREILKGGEGTLANNIHVAEERGIALPDSSMNEEDRYSGVIRSSGAYIPPGARRGSPSVPAADGTSKSPSSATLPAGNSASTIAAGTQAPFQDPAILSASGSSRLPASTAPNSRIPTSAASAANNASGVNALRKSKATLDGHILKFVSDEKEKLNERKQALMREAKDAAEKKEKDSKLRSLLEFSQTFKLKAGTPTDLASIIGDTRVPPTGAAGSSTSRPGVIGGSSATATAVAPNSNTAKSSAPLRASSAAKLLPEIPPFNPARAKAAAEAQVKAQGNGAPDRGTAVTPRLASAAPPPSSFGSLAGLNPVASTSKMTATAPAFVFKPNPNASTFTPGASLSTGPMRSSPSPSPHPTSVASTAATAQGPKPNSPVASGSLSLPPMAHPIHPFFGNKPFIKGHHSLHVKEEFAPFKSGVPDPTTVDPRWSFHGKPYRAIYPLQSLGHHGAPLPPGGIGFPLITSPGPDVGGAGSSDDATNVESGPAIQTSNVGVPGVPMGMRMVTSNGQTPMHPGLATYGVYPPPPFQPGGFGRFPPHNQMHLPNPLNGNMPPQFQQFGSLPPQGAIFQPNGPQMYNSPQMQAMASPPSSSGAPYQPAQPR